MEMLKLLFVITSTILFIVLGVIWSTKSWIDILVKVIMLVLAFIGGVLILKQYHIL